MNKAALIIIDMQNDFVLSSSPNCVNGAINTVETIFNLLECFRSHHDVVIHAIREYRVSGVDVEDFRYDRFIKGNQHVISGSTGAKIIDKLSPAENEIVLVKNRFSAFFATELDLILRRLDIKTLVVVGTQYPNCIRATIYDALSLGYHVINVTDATSSQTVSISRNNITDLNNVGVECISYTNFIEKYFSNSSTLV